MSKTKAKSKKENPKKTSLSSIKKEIDNSTKTNEIAIKLVNITKTFLNGTIVANDKISFEIFKNEIHALIGENGAGKSTLTSIIFGLYEQDSGEIYINNKLVKFHSAADARKYKIGMVHQHFKLVENYTVLQNIILGVEPTKILGFIDYSSVRKKLNSLIKKYNFKINIDAKISTLAVSDQQKVEILKLLFVDSDILIFDEPTAVLSDDEISSFLNMVKDFKKEGKTIIIISHKLNEIKEVADFATVIRHGKVVSHFDVKKASIKELAEAMVGRTLNKIQNDETTSKFGEVIVEVNDLRLPLLKNPNVKMGLTKFMDNFYRKTNLSKHIFNFKKWILKIFYDYPIYWLKTLVYKLSNKNKEKPKLVESIISKNIPNFNEEGISFKIREGEIFAIAGVSGNGQSELIQYISGLKKAPNNSIFIRNSLYNDEFKSQEKVFSNWFKKIINLDDQVKEIKYRFDKYIDMSYKPIKNRYLWGLSFIPEDRHEHGLFLDDSVAFNSVSNQLYKNEFSKFGFLNFSSMNNNAIKIIEEYDVRGASSLQSNVRGLSGGNQQKLIIGREIMKNNKFIIFAQPTRGLDLGAIEYIHKKILEERSKNKAILLISYELDEILSLADTIAVMSKDKIVGMGSKKEMTRTKIAELMAHTNLKEK